MDDIVDNKVLEKIQAICDAPNSRSQLFHLGSSGHLNGIRHLFESSSEVAQCSVEPGSAKDLSEIMKIIKEYKVEFAASIHHVKGGGHTSNPRFSSTEGLQISMSRFNKLSFIEEKLVVGAGCTFDEIYRYIQPKGFNIVGGGGSVGIGGWLLGGGYSHKTNQFGLGIDNLVQAEIVLPDGTIATASGTGDYKDLFWAIKGGGNNFGIATEFVLKTHRQGNPPGPYGLVYGGLLTYGKNEIEKVKNTIVAFMGNTTDPKANMEAAFRFVLTKGEPESTLVILGFYDDTQPTPNPFQGFLDIEHSGNLKNWKYTEVENAKTLMHNYIPTKEAVKILFGSEGGHGKGKMSFPQQIAGLGVTNARARWGTVMVSHYTANLINAIEAEGKAASKLMEKNNGKMVITEMWPFLPTMFDNVDDSVGSAWPHEKGKPIGPLIVYFMWEGKDYDKVWIPQMKRALENIQEVARNEGCAPLDAPVYYNTALADSTTAHDIYRGNLTLLSALRRKYDPDNVMKNTGGFRIPPDL